jgi:hypothetical protein
MKKILLFLLLNIITTAIYAQRDSTKLPSNGMIKYSRHSFFRAGGFTVDGKQQTFSEVNTRLMNSPASAAEFKEYKKYRNLTYYMGGVAVASLLASAIVPGNSNTFKNTSSKVLFGMGLGFIIPEAIFAGKRDKHYKRSFESYNQQFQ